MSTSQPTDAVLEEAVNPYADHPVIAALKESGVFPLDNKFAYDTADEFDLNVTLPKDNELQIDIDNHEAWTTFQRVFPILESRYGPVAVEKHSSRSGGEKYHVTVSTTKNFASPMERILLQACLGSDPVRELLGYYRILDGIVPPTLFFEPKPQKDTVIEYGHKYTPAYGLCTKCHTNEEATVHQTYDEIHNSSN